MQWERVFKSFQALEQTGKQHLADAVRQWFGQQVGDLGANLGSVREHRFSDGIFCPHCGETNVCRNGRLKDKSGRHPESQRYLCRGCGRSFNDFTASPMAGTKYPDKWMACLNLMLEGASCRAIAKSLGMHVSTAFHWRHKVLRALDSLGDHELTGIIEADDTYFLESSKGTKVRGRKPRQRGGPAGKRGLSKQQVSVLAAIDRSGDMFCRVAGRGSLRAGEIDAVLGHVITGQSTLVTDKASGFSMFATQKGLAHKPVEPAKKVRNLGLYHIQHVNSFHRRLKQWMDRFNGVATKYLDNYLTWFIWLERTKTAEPGDRLCTLLYDATKKMVRTTTDMFPWPEAA